MLSKGCEAMKIRVRDWLSMEYADKILKLIDVRNTRPARRAL